VIGFSGSLKGWHGVDVLCDAFRRVAADPRLHLLVVGDGPERKEVTRLADELPGRVTMDRRGAARGGARVAARHGHRRGAVSAARAVLLLAAQDPGRHGLRRRERGLGHRADPELLRDGETGPARAAGDAAALGSALERLAGDAALRKRLADAALEEARANHVWSARAADIVAVAMRQPELVPA
jgi:glycosyltransferase involved in cell wall biosynthesis